MPDTFRASSNISSQCRYGTPVFTFLLRFTWISVTNFLLRRIKESVSSLTVRFVQGRRTVSF